MNIVQRVRQRRAAPALEEPVLLRITAAQFLVMVQAGAFTGDRGTELSEELL